jgi:hypothetical protein
MKTEKAPEGPGISLIAGTFDWLAAQKKPTHKNHFGKGRRFQGASKFEKKPGPNSYKLNNKWTDANHILKTACSLSNFKSVYYS